MINDLAAGLKPYTQEELDAINGQQGGEFTRGMRSGTLSLRAGANNFSGAVADRLGFKDFAQGEFAEADDLSLRAQQAAPRVSSVRDISSLRDFGDWGAGVAGQLVPSAALGIGAGLLAPAAAGVGGAMAAGTLAYAPSEIGEVIGRQRAAGQPTNLRDAALGGGASAALGAVVPGLVAGKLAGRALSTAPLTLARGARDVAGGALLEGGTEAGGEVTKQYATDRTLPTSDTLIDAGAAGALGGGAMSGLGVAGEAAHRGIAAPGKTLTTARDKVSALAGQAEDKVSALAGQAQEGLKSAAGATQQAVEDLSPSQKAADTLAGLSAKVKSSARDAIDRVEQGLPAGDLGALSAALQGKTGAARDAILAAADNETVQTVAKWAKDLSEDAGLTPERRTKLATAMQDMGSEASRATIAGLKKAHEASKDLGDSVNRLYESTKAWAEESDLKGKAKGLAAKGLDAAVRGVDKVQDMVDRARFKRGAGGDGDVVDMPEATPARKALPGVKKSEDFAGIRRVVMEHVAPALQEVNPSVLEDQANLPKVASSIRMFIEQVAKREPGQLPSDTVVHLIDLFGGKTTDVLDRVYRAVMGEDRGQAENFFGALNQIREMQKKDTDLLGVMRQNLKPALQVAYTMPELRLMAQELSAWMQRAPGGKSQQDIFFDQKVMQQLGETFDKPDAVIAALTEIAKDTKLQQDKAETKSVEGGFEDPTDGEGEGVVDARITQVRPERMTDPAKHRAQYGNESQAERIIREYGPPAKGERLQWMRASEYHERTGITPDVLEGSDPNQGYVVSMKQDDSDSLDEQGLRRFKFDTRKGDVRTSKSALKTEDGAVFDAMKMGRPDKSRELAWSGDEDSMARLARVFFDNVAAVQAAAGKTFKIPDDTVVAVRGGREVTAGELRKLDKRTLEDKAHDQAANRLIELRKQYKGADEETQAEIRKEAERLADSLDFARVRDWTQGEWRGESTNSGIPDLNKVRRREADARAEAARKRGDERGAFEATREADQLAATDATDTVPAGHRIATLRKNIAAAQAALDMTTGRAAIVEMQARIDRAEAKLNALVAADKKARSPDTDEGRTEVGPDEEIHTSAKALGKGEKSYKSAREPGQDAPDLVRKFNADGTPTSPQAPSSMFTAPVMSLKTKGKVITPPMITPEGLRALDSFVARAEAKRGTYPSALQNKTAARLTTVAREYIDDLRADPQALSMGQVRQLQSALDPRLPMSQRIEIMKKLKNDVPPRDEPIMRPWTDEDTARYGEGEELPSRANQGLRDTVRAATRMAQASEDAEARVMTIEQETAYRKALAKGDVIGANAIKFAAEQGAPPSPKAVAAKKAAFLEKARSGDAELLKTLAKSDDAKGLQRAAQALKGEQGEGITRTADTINKRLGELVQDDETRYGMQLGKKYSLMGLRVHEELGRPGFAATHDSPIRHEGRFDWRSHQGKGEGNAAFGAGTYLSTAEGVHKSYKGQFTAKAEREAPQSAYVQALRDEVNENSDALLGLMQERDELGKWRARIGGRLDHFDTQEAAREALDDYRQGRLDRLAALKQKLVDKVNPDGLEYNISAIRKDIAYIEDKLLETDGNQPERLQDLIDETTEAGRAMLKRYEDAKAAQPNTKSPTYEVSVDIPQDQLLDWNAPLSKQPAARAVLEKDKHAVGAYDVQFNMGMGVGLDATATGEDIYRALKAELGSARAASEYLQSLGILGHKYAAAGGKNDKHPNYVIYDDSRITTNYVHFSKGFVDPQNATTSNARSQVLGYINTVLGQSVQVAFKKFADMPHAGEFEPQSATNPADVIRISVHALNPLSTAYHESLHAWFKQLSAAGLTDVMKPLLRAADGVVVRRQLERLLAHEPDALSQLHDAEERVAYMYQFWSTGQLKVGPDTKTIFNKIADFFREVLGIWSNDTRAEKIMEYFNSGAYKRDMNSPSAITKATLDAGRNKAVTTLRNMADPLVRLTNEVATAGGQRLRDTGIPALNELANLMKATGRDEQKDPGFIPAARNERARVMNQLGAALHGVSKAHVAEALEALQKGQRATSLEARTAAIMVKKILSDSKAYMQAAGVNVSGLGPDYFPRVYDTSYISRHQDEFVTVLEAHGVSNAREIMLKLVSADGNEFRIEAPMPGMQHLKERKLAFVPDEVLEPFMRKDLFEIMNSYVTQATRRAEWARRFEADGSKLRALMEQAEWQGATPKEIAAAEKYVKAVDGTLGDDINPTARRVMGDMIVYQNIRLMPLAIFSSIVDPNGILVRGGTVGDAFSTFKRGIREMAKNFQKDPQSDAATEFAELIGTVDRAAMAHTIGSAYTQGMVGDTGRKVNDLFFRYNLMEQFNTSMRVGATQAALKFIVRHKDGTRSPHSARWIKELGLGPADIQVDAFGELKVLPSQGLTEAQSAKIKMAINRWVDGAVLRPDAADKPPWMSDPHWALIAHLKQFTFAFHETIIKRVVHEYQNGNYSPAMALTGYVPIMIAADMVKGLIQGGGEEPEWKQNWTASDYIWSGVQRGGLLGTGQFVVDMAGDVRDGGIGVGALSGPTIEQLADAVRVLDGREQFDHFAIKSMPANALYATAFGGEATDPAFSE